MNVLTALKSWIAPTPELREERAARRTLEKHTKHLETELLRRYEESLEISARPILPWERLYDGEKLLFPAGFPQDRQAGRNRPMLETDQGLREMRAFSRLLCDTNLVCLGFRDHITNFVVGKGYEWQVVLRGQKSGPTSAGLEDKDGDGQPDVDPDIEACQQVLDEFKRQHGWGESGDTIVQMDQNDDESPVGNTEREAYQRAMADGECFVRLFRGGSETNGIPRMRFVEPECIMTPPGSAITSPWGWGILTDDQDSVCRKAYHIVPTDQYGTEGEIVPASRVVHFKLNTVTSVKRGIPDFWPLADEATGVRTLVRNVLDVSGILAAIAYIREHAPTTTSDQVRTMIGNSASGIDTINRVTPGSYGVENNAGPDRTSYLNMHRVGTIIDVSNQLRYTPGPVNTGIPGFIQAEQATLRMIGLRWGCPEYFSGDSSNANFASTLVSGGPFERSATARQQDYGMFSAKLAARVLAMAVESGRLRAEQVRRVAVRIVVPPVVISNKDADTNRRKTLFDSKILDPQTWITEEGYDPNVVAANIKAWNQQFPDDAGGGMGGLFGGGGDDGGDGGDGGTGGGDDFASLFGESRIEEGFSGVITDKAGRRRHYIDGKQVKAGTDFDSRVHAAKRLDSDRENTVGKAIQNINQLAPEQLEKLSDHIHGLNVDRLRTIARSLSQKVGGKKAELAARLLETIRSNRGDNAQYDSELANYQTPKTQTRENGTPEKPVKSDVYTVPVGSLKTDPSRFQYKVSGIGKDGVTDELRGTDTYDPELGGVLLVWRDPKTQQDYIVNGHHRHELATRANAESVNVRYLDSPTDREARARGALANIAEGRGTATDAAKYLRDSGQDIEHLRKAGISLTGKVAADAANLTALSDDAFQRLTTGRLSEQTAVSVSKHLKDHKRQDELFRKLRSREEDGKDWSNREIEQASKKLAKAGSITVSDTNLFGSFEDEESTWEQEVEIEAYIAQKINQRIGDYSAVANQKRADRVSDAGNILSTDENQRRKDRAAADAAAFDRLSGTRGQVSDMITDAAARLKTETKKAERERIKAQVYAEVQKMLTDETPVYAGAN